jgi:hypothetical protein
MATQASPGLNAPSAYQALPGIPSNMSALAAQSAGILPSNLQLTNPLLGGVPRALLETHAAAGTHGTANNVGVGGFATMNNAMNGGSGLGPCNAAEFGPGPGTTAAIACSTPATNIQTATPPNYQG